MDVEITLPPELGAHPARLHTESLQAAPLGPLRAVDDRLTADDALRSARRGELLLYVGDHRNARQLLAAMSRRLGRRRTTARSPLESFRSERRQRMTEHALLGRLLVAIDADGQLALRRAPAVGAAVEAALGPRQGWLVLPLTELLGMIGAFEWRRRGVTVEGLPAPITAGYGVFAPTRKEPAELVARIPDARGRTILDLGTGTGVLAFLLLARGASEALGTDADARAIACARENAARLGFGERFSAVEADVFPESAVRADIIVANPPWLPLEPETRLDAAVFDAGGSFLGRFFAGLRDHLVAGGAGYLVISNLAELIGLRATDALPKLAAEQGLSLTELAAVAAAHPKAQDRSDPLFAVRSKERVSLYVSSVKAG